MTTEEAIDILIKRGSNNEEEVDALNMLIVKAQLYDFLNDTDED